jgi:protein-S-isoprenylcysteine O-methyltransferase Ste14
MNDRPNRKVHLIMLLAGLLNLAILPFWRLSTARATTIAIGYPLFAVGLALNLLSLLALKRGFGGRIEPVAELATDGVYARLRRPMYVGFAITMLGLDVLLGSLLGLLVTLLAFLPSMVWRARLEEQALARRFGPVWSDHVGNVPSLPLWDMRRE